jgi:hypothetical protein
MKYAQIKGGNKLHLVYEAGEGVDAQHLIPINCFSAPLCGTRYFKGNYRMTINVPLAHACKNCLRVYSKRYEN